VIAYLKIKFARLPETEKNDSPGSVARNLRQHAEIAVSCPLTPAGKGIAIAHGGAQPLAERDNAVRDPRQAFLHERIVTRNN
jgi:hypothetical protein